MIWNSILIQLMARNAARLWIDYRSKLQAINKESKFSLINAERPEPAEVALTLPSRQVLGLMINEEVLKERKLSDILSMQLVLLLKTLKKKSSKEVARQMSRGKCLVSNFVMLSWSTQMLKIAHDAQHTTCMWKQALIWGQPGFAFSSRHVMWVWHPEHAAEEQDRLSGTE